MVGKSYDRKTQLNAPLAFRDVTNSARDIKPNAGGGKQNKRIHDSSVQTKTTVLSCSEVLGKRNSTQQSDGSNPQSYQYTGQVDDIDERDSDDPLQVTEYVTDLYQYFREKESSVLVRPTYMKSQPNINEKMRGILVDWLVEVHLKLKLVPETLYLTVNLIDRYLERQNIFKKSLQLVGVTCLLIASKYEEIYPPELRDLVYICDKTYKRKEIVHMEYNILKSLEYRITIPTAHAFLVRYLKAAHADRSIVQISCYILDGTLQSYSLLQYLPSQLASAAIMIARRTIRRNPWSPTLLKYSSYTEEDITPIARVVLAEKSSASPSLRALRKKYTTSKYGYVAKKQFATNF
mmetsp:Transcript_37090/g.42317  ORF Transcript_37090/g.42317 Transcript_37090/m.42317 type:complete len:349 (-) Transcript_37090:212-1258(-)